MVAATPDSGETQRLLDGIAAGDAAAFDRLFARHRPFLRRLVARRLDQQLRARVDPSDIVQETHMEAFHRFRDYLERRPMPFRLWLFQTARERVAKARRTHAQAARRSVTREVYWPRDSSIQFGRELLARTSSPSERLSRQELAERVNQALGQLAETDREILWMRTFENLSYEEVSCVLDIAPTAARKRYGRALLRLRKLLLDTNPDDLLEDG